MKRMALVFSLLLSTASFAGTGDSVPLCTDGSPPDCVQPNWGQIEPGATDDVGMTPANPTLAATPTAPKQHPAVHMLPTAAPATVMAPNGSSPLKAVVSPQGLFPKETAALLAALKRARFNEDGSIKTGEAAVRRAAAAASKRAGDKYTLTLYIKVPQKLAPDHSVALGKKVDALNAVLSSPYEGGQTGTPKT